MKTFIFEVLSMYDRKSRRDWSIKALCKYKFGHNSLRMIFTIIISYNISYHVMHITNCCLMTQHFSSIKKKKRKEKKALLFIGYFAL